MSKNKNSNKPIFRVPLNKVFKIWYSNNENIFLPEVNIARLIELRLKNPNLHITLIYSSTLLNADTLKALKEFCHNFNINPVSIEKIMAKDREGIDEVEKNLNKLISLEIRSFKDNQGGSAGAASDLTRIKKPILTEYGIYSDFDVDLVLNGREYVDIGTEFLFDIISFNSQNLNDVEANNNIIALTYDQNGSLKKESLTFLSELQQITLNNMLRTKSVAKNLKKLYLKKSIMPFIEESQIFINYLYRGEPKMTNYIMVNLFREYIKRTEEKDLSWYNFRIFLESLKDEEIILSLYEVASKTQGINFSLSTFKNYVVRGQRQYINKESPEDILSELCRSVILDLLTDSIVLVTGPQNIHRMRNIKRFSHDAEEKLYLALNEIAIRDDNDLSYLHTSNVESVLERKAKLNASKIEKAKFILDVSTKALKEISSSPVSNTEENNFYKSALKYIFSIIGNSNISQSIDDSWYSAEQVENLLNYFALNTAGVRNVFIPSHNQLEHEVTLENIYLALERVKNGEVALIPLNVNNNHWVGMTIRLVNDLYEIVYLDPYGNALSNYDSNSIIKSFLDIMLDGNYELIQVTARQQENGHDCGPITVNNLHRILQYITIHPEQPLNQEILETQILNLNIQDTAQALREEYNLILNPAVPENISDSTENSIGELTLNSLAVSSNLGNTSQGFTTIPTHNSTATTDGSSAEDNLLVGRVSLDNLLVGGVPFSVFLPDQTS